MSIPYIGYPVSNDFKLCWLAATEGYGLATSSDFRSNDIYNLYLAILDLYNSEFNPLTNVYNGISYNVADGKIQLGDDLTGSGQQGAITKDRFIWLPSNIIRILQTAIKYTDIGNGIVKAYNNTLYTEIGGGYINGHNSLKFQVSGAIYGRIDNNTKWRIGDGNSANAILEIIAGSATALGAPQKMNSGALLSTPEAGAVNEYNGHFFDTLSSTMRMSRFGKLKQNLTQATANNGTVQMDSLSILANTCKTNGDTIIIKGNGSFANVGISANAINILLGGSTILQFSLAVGFLANFYQFEVKVTRVSATSMFVSGWLNSYTTASPSIQNGAQCIGVALALDATPIFANNQTLQIILVSTTATNLIMDYDEIIFEPAKE